MKKRKKRTSTFFINVTYTTSKLHISFQISPNFTPLPCNNIQTDSVKRGKPIGLDTCVDVASGILAISKFDGRNVLRRDINSKV